MTLNHLDAALSYWDAGYSIIPILADGTKRPQLKWEQYQAERATRDQVKQWFTASPTSGIGIICGRVSGNVEMLELEGRANDGETHSLLVEAMEEAGLGDFWAGLLDTGYVAATPSGGLHIMYRITDHAVPGNTKVARRPANAEELAENPRDRVKVLSETRGEGGYFIAAPSGGTVHKTGDSWTLLSAGGDLWELSWDIRCDIHDVIHAVLDKMPAPAAAPERPAQPVAREGLAPGEDFNNKQSWRTLLEAYGWTYHSMMGSEQLWTRPGKDVREGHSASLYYQGSDNFYIWSSSTELPSEEPISKFAFYTFMEHNGDFSAAARALSREGFGDRREAALDISDWFETPGVGADLESQTPAVASVVETPTKKVSMDSDGLPKLDADVYKNFDWRESSLPRLFEDTYHQNLKYVASSRSWRIWDGTRWDEDGRGAAVRASVKLLATACKYADAVNAKDEERGEILVKAAKTLSSMNKMKALSSLAQSGARIACKHSDFDKAEHLVTVENGILDLRSAALIPHDRTKMLTKKMAVTFDPDADGSVLDKYLTDWMPDPEVRAYVARLLAVTLSGTADERVIPMLYGGSGSGKTAFLEMIYHVFGDFGAIAAEAALKPRADQDGPSEKLHQLKGSRMVKLSELSQGSVLNEALVKSITGSDTQTTRKLYGDIEEWKVQYMVWLATNHLPTISSNDEAIWKRVKPINFPGCFVDAQGRVANPEDRDLGRKLASAHASAVLNWILAGLKDYRENGLNEPDQIGEWLEQYRDDVDTVRQFLAEAPDSGQLKLGDDLEIGSRDLYKIYVAWSQENHIKPLSIKSFSQRMGNSKYKKARNNKGMVWKGLAHSGFLGDSQTAAGRGFWN